MPEPILFCDGASGIYIPQRFAEEVKRDCVTGVDAHEFETLALGPDTEWYWDTWADVLDNAKVHDPVANVTYTLHQDGDLWLLPEGYTGPLVEDA